MKIIPQQEITHESWDALVAGSRQAWLFHLADWISLETKIARSQNLSFGIERGGRLVAIMPLYCSKLGLGYFEETLVHNGLHRHTGLALAPDLTLEDVKLVRRVAMDRIMGAAHTVDADRIYLGQQNLAPESRSLDRAEIPFWVRDYGFQLGNSFGPAGLAPAPGLATTVIDQIIRLELDESELLANLSKGCRRDMRKAKRAGVSAHIGTYDDDCVSEYYRIAQLSARRTGERLPQIDYYHDLQRVFAKQGLCTFLFVKVDGRAAAAAILLHYQNCMYYFSGVSDLDFLSLMVNDLLQWSAILLGKARGYTHYRLGPYFPTVPKEWPIEKMARFKAKFGADPWTIIQGSLFLKPKRYIPVGEAYVRQLCEELDQ